MHLEIPEPCHENWNEMTPKEQGSFCGKCCKVVIDFTNMATDKVIEFISERSSEKVCGRFRPDQIVIPSSQKTERNFSHRAKVFLAALVFVFGGLLFTGCASQEPEKMGKVAAADFNYENNFSTENNVVDSPNVKSHFMGDTIIPSQDEQHTKGRVKCVNPDTTHVNNIAPLGGPTIIKDEPKLMGKVSMPRTDTAK